MLSSINQNNSALLGQSFDCSFQSFQMTTKKKLTPKNLFKTPTKLPTLSRKFKNLKFSHIRIAESQITEYQISNPQNLGIPK